MNNKSQTIKINNSLIYCNLINEEYRTDNKPVLVFLHEGLGSVAQWKDFPGLLSIKTQYSALVYDRYGYGESEAVNKPRTASYLNDEACIFLPELLKKLKISEKIILVGHSDGGTISLLYASHFPEHTKAVITEADHVISEEITLSGIKNIVVEYEKKSLKKLLSKFHHEKTDAMFYSWSRYWLSDEQNIWSIEDRLTLIESPVLAIQGKNDCYGSVKQLASKLEKINGQIEILYIPDCGHVPHFEFKTLVLEKMKTFILNLPQDI